METDPSLQVTPSHVEFGEVQTLPFQVLNWPTLAHHPESVAKRKHLDLTPEASKLAS